ncbi:hypothetical protein Cch01nite_15140 [Cellulomonas chitinilytica]|uniref:Transcriptional regulator HTH-type FeoC domain-containing protein n=1 Tax=Cellulomonas chitinilytica TaxID=398759 RepID=A0A919P206_9CELL|nr:hypothetical protein [Cellulomonas chitinilytica]GIG20790.1 hypothetical protein Cch01nite_15140 [Cellulomonas chitinilytica]
MTVLADVLRETDRGLRPGRVAERLGLPVDLVTATLDHAVHAELVVRPSGACTDCAPVAARPPSCAGCMFATPVRTGRAPAGSR